MLFPSKGPSENPWWRMPSAAVACMLLPTAFAGVSGDPAWPDLADLGKIEVVSVSRRETPLDQTPAAVSVLTEADIRRSAGTTVPLLLRLVPGLDVSQIGATTIGLGVRGFGSEQSNKLLVMIDNRSLSNPIYGGTNWSSENLYLADVERIEVLRGAGGSAWGANAVNGVINVVNKSAWATQGGLLSVSLGTQPESSVSLRQGVTLGDKVAMRVFAKQDRWAESKLVSGEEAGDPVDNLRGGLRLDWDPNRYTRITFNGEAYQMDRDLMIYLPSLASPTGLLLKEQSSKSYGAFARTRLEQHTASGDRLSTQLSVERAHSDTVVFSNNLTIVDFDAQYSASLGSLNQVTGGLGYRLTHDASEAGRVARFAPMKASNNLCSGFLQHEFDWRPARLRTLGVVRVEHHDQGGWTLQPTLRVMYSINEYQSLWVASSRAVRIPSRVPTEGAIQARVLPAGTLSSLPVLVEVYGDRNLHNEVLWSQELGYHWQMRPDLCFKFSLYHNEYKGLVLEQLLSSQIHYVATPAPAHLLLPSVYANSRDADVDGGELSLDYRPLPWWTLSGHCSRLRIAFQNKPAGAALERDEGYTPRWISGLRSAMELGDKWELTLDLRHSSARWTIPVKAYWELDARITWKASSTLELSLVGQNLLDKQHAESYPLTTNFLPREIQRAAYGQLTWRY